MARVVVDVMLKPEILDPQGQAVARRAAAARASTGVTDVRQGKRFELEVDGDGRRRARSPEVDEIAETLLANPVIEDFTVRGRGRRVTARIGVVTFPGSLDDRDAARAVRAGRRPSRSRSGTATTTCTGVDAVVLPGGFSYGDYLRCGAIARFAPVMDDVVAGGQRRPAGARHLQRLPGPVRVAPAARRADPQRPPALRLPRPAAARSRTPTTAWTAAYAAGQRDRHPAEERRGRLRRRRAHARRARGRGPGRRPLPRRQPQRLAAATSPASPTRRGNVVGLMPHPEHAVEDADRPVAPTGSASSPRCSSRWSAHEPRARHGRARGGDARTSRSRTPSSG